MEQIEHNESIKELWRVTQGQRTKYLLAIIAMAITNICMFSAPIVGGHAIDVITLQDFSHADQLLLKIGTLIFGQMTFTG